MRCTGISVAHSLPRLYLSSLSLRYIGRGQYRVVSHQPRNHTPPSVRYASTHRVDVPVGGNGYVSLNITPSSAANKSRNVIIHLPPGPLFRREDVPKPLSQNSESESLATHYDNAEDATSARRLAALTSTTVVTINYRLGLLTTTPSPRGPESEPHQPASDTQSKNPQNQLYQYPTPIHDTLAGFDWVLQTLKPTRLGIYGTHIGGSLALMLALTEPHSVHAVAAREPVCDWTSLDEHCRTEPDQTSLSPRRKIQPPAPWDLVPLLHARESLFASPERSFDAFASPMLFLRSAGKDVPKQFPRYLTGPEYPVPVLENPEPSLPEEDPRSEDSGIDVDPPPLDSDPDSSDQAEKGITAPPLIRRRKALSRWPPYGLDYGVSGSSSSSYRHQNIKRLEVTLPHVRLFARLDGGGDGDGEEPPAAASEAQTKKNPAAKKQKKHSATVLSQQAGDMVDVLRRACFWGKEKGFGEERVTLAAGSGSRSGATSGEWSDGVTEAGEWMCEVLHSEG